MKKILNLLGTITLIGTSTTSLVACDKIINKNKINDKIKTTLQPPTINNWNFVDSSLNNIQKEFENYNNKWYFVIWKRGTVVGWEWQTSFFKYNESAPRMTGAWLDKIKSIYCWNGVGDPKRPKINNDGIIIDWS